MNACDATFQFRGRFQLTMSTCDALAGIICILYENCHQLNDATDAYRTAVALAPSNAMLKERLKTAQQRKQAQQLAQIQTTAYYY